MEKRTILGIDPGTLLLGYGVIRVEGGRPVYVATDFFDLRKIKEPYEKLANIFAGVSELIETFGPDELAVESPFLSKNPQVVLKLGRAQGAAMTAAAIKGLPVTEYAPREAKIAVCGNGAASKAQVRAMIEKTLGISIGAKYNDAPDALAIALCHFYRQFSPLASARPAKRGSGRWEDFLAENPDRIKNK